MSYGRKGNILNKIKDRFFSLIFNKKIIPAYAIEKNEIIDILQQSYNYLEFPAQNAKLKISNENDDITINIEKEKLGETINYKKGLEKLINNINNFQNFNITLKNKISYPEIYKEKINNIEKEITKLMSLAPIKFSSTNKEWQINKKIFSEWLTLKKENNEKINISLNEEKITNYLKSEIAPNINKKPVKAEFNIENSKVISFQIAEKGLKLDIKKSLDNTIKELVQNKNNEIKLTVSEIGYKGSSNIDLGIKEIIGTGHSNFYRSSSNRKQNIKVGAETLNGMLIEPGQEFSLVEALGEINAETGYLEELVIKGNETIPEYGGGLCQISTTIFRTALASGLPITERHNHSYRVSYYEPAGTDSTIYNPSPDLKFINDTKNYIMIQYKINDNDLSFDFWGTLDKRIATTTYPTIYGIIKPPPTKYIESEDIEPGTIKCTERAHNGAHTYFDYTVIYAETEDSPAKIKEKRFYSHYVPWQEICLISKENSEEEDDNAENTENENDNAENTKKNNNDDNID
jgi:vancomycin resistance protein YoaR